VYGNYLSNLSKFAFFSSSSSFNDYNRDDKNKGERQKTPIVPKITLINDNKMEIVTMEQAKKIADKRQMKLINIVDFDTKSKRKIFK
jgi:hypothetical protein